MIKDPLVFLKHILECINNIDDFSRGVSKEKLMADKLTQSAIIRQLEIIGEAVKNLPKNSRKSTRKWNGTALQEQETS